MAVFTNVLSRLRGRKDTPSPPIMNRPGPGGNRPDITVRYVSTFGGAGGTPTRDYESLARLGYTTNSDVYACVSLIATAAKQVRWDKSPGAQALASIALLAKSGGAEFIEWWLSYLLLSGNAFIEVGRNASGAPVALHLIQPDRVTAKVSLTARYPEVETWRVLDAHGMPYPVAKEDMLHSRLFNPTDQLRGMSPLEAAMLLVGARNEGATLLQRLFARGYSPGWIEAAKDSLWEDEQVSQLKLRIQQSKHDGSELFLENASYHQIGFSPAEAGISDQQVLSKRDIASVFHVPSVLIGDAAASTYNNYQQARQALYQEAVIPLLSHFRDDWNRTIGRERQSALMFDKDSFDAITLARAEATDRVHKLWTSGVITQNEARRDLEYDEVPGGDVFYAPANFMPMTGQDGEG